jgi:hypothetical protein
MPCYREEAARIDDISDTTEKIRPKTITVYTSNTPSHFPDLSTSNRSFL